MFGDPGTDPVATGLAWLCLLVGAGVAAVLATLGLLLGVWARRQ